MIMPLPGQGSSARHGSPGSEVHSTEISREELLSLLRLFNECDERREATVSVNGEPVTFVAEGRQVEE